jgi:hypothetical protein
VRLARYGFAHTSTRPEGASKARSVTLSMWMLPAHISRECKHRRDCQRARTASGSSTSIQRLFHAHGAPRSVLLLAVLQPSPIPQFVQRALALRCWSRWRRPRRPRERGARNRGPARGLALWQALPVATGTGSLTRGASEWAPAPAHCQQPHVATGAKAPPLAAGGPSSQQ